MQMPTKIGRIGGFELEKNGKNGKEESPRTRVSQEKRWMNRESRSVSSE